MIIALVGGEDFTDEQMVREICQFYIHDGDTVIEDGRSEAHRYASMYINELKGEVVKFIQPKIGPMIARNRDLIDHYRPDMIICFGDCVETKHMKYLCSENKITCIEVEDSV